MGQFEQAPVSLGISEVIDLRNNLTYNSNISYVDGYAIKLGRLVQVALRIRITAAIANNTNIITGFPLPLNYNSANFVYPILIGNNEQLGVKYTYLVTTTGALKTFSNDTQGALAAGVYILNFSYIAAT